jgi:hypothetical protein
MKNKVSNMFRGENVKTINFVKLRIQYISRRFRVLKIRTE